MRNSQPHLTQKPKEPAHIRDRVQDYDDPYIPDEKPPENSVCKVCGDIFTAGRWYNPDQLDDRWQRTHMDQKHMIVCPGCRRQGDRLPAGVLRITGEFALTHRDEILNLIRNETKKADSINPLERIISMETEGSEITISTTNDRLAQRLGKALHKAYSGDVEYNWSKDNKLARVNWHRDE